MMWNYGDMDGGNWLWMVPMMVLSAGVFVAIVVLVARSFSGPKGDGDQAMNTLRTRLASGQITQDEYEKTSRLLKG